MTFKFHFVACFVSVILLLLLLLLIGFLLTVVLNPHFLRAVQFDIQNVRCCFVGVGVCKKRWLYVHSESDRDLYEWKGGRNGNRFANLCKRPMLTVLLGDCARSLDDGSGWFGFNSDFVC